MTAFRVEYTNQYGTDRHQDVFGVNYVFERNGMTYFTQVEPAPDAIPASGLLYAIETHTIHIIRQLPQKKEQPANVGFPSQL